MARHGYLEGGREVEEFKLMEVQITLEATNPKHNFTYHQPSSPVQLCSEFNEGNIGEFTLEGALPGSPQTRGL